MKKIGILGSGVVAQTLGSGFIKHGYSVMLGTRYPEKLKDWQSKNKASVGSYADSAEFGELLVLAVKGRYAKVVLDQVPTALIKGKTIIDVCNPISDREPEDGVLSFYTGCYASLMEELQMEFPGAHFVKAFNSVGHANMVNPVFKEGKPSMFICGNTMKAKKEVVSIVKKFGWEPEDMGTVLAATYIEQLSILWCIPGFRENRWSHAFKLLKV